MKDLLYSVRYLLHNKGTNIIKIVMLARGVSCIALPAIVFGVIISFMVGSEWLQQFALKIPLHVTLFVLSGISIFTVIQFCVIARSIPIATSNPVDFLKSE